MRTILFTALIATGFAFTGAGSNEAKADNFGLHVSGPGYHFDIGRAHGRNRGHYGRPYRSHYSSWRGRDRHRDHSWHDTSHWDYHPGEFVPHYDQYHYVPGHYDWHEDGHWHHHHP